MNVYSTGIASSVSLDSNGDITRLFWGLGDPASRASSLWPLRTLGPITTTTRIAECQKSNRFYKLNNNFTLAAHFVHFFAVTARLEHDVKCVNFLSLSEFGCGVLVLRNSTQGQFAYFWQGRWVEIIAMKVERIIIIIGDDDDDDDISKWIR